MYQVMLVDDDLGFIQTFKEIPFANIEILAFTNPVDAIKLLRSIRPRIIISDVQMPGVHGVDFHFIVSEMYKPEHFIYISANSLQEIERKYGKVSGKFFQKPLEDNFYDYIESLAAAAPPPEAKSEALSPLQAQDLDIKLSQLNAFVEIWEKAQSDQYKMNIKHKFLSYSDMDSEQHAKNQSALMAARKILNLDDTAFDKLIQNISTQHPPWFKRVENEFCRSIQQFSRSLDPPMTISHLEMLGPGSLSVHSYSIELDPQGGVTVKINGKVHHPVVSHFPAEEQPAAAILMASAVFDVLETCNKVKRAQKS